MHKFKLCDYKQLSKGVFVEGIRYIHTDDPKNQFKGEYIQMFVPNDNWNSVIKDIKKTKKSQMAYVLGYELKKGVGALLQVIE